MASKADRFLLSTNLFWPKNENL